MDATNRRHLTRIIAVVFPVLVLAGMAGHRLYIGWAGQKIVLPVTGYDPRDLLAGHYVRYSVDYGLGRGRSGQLCRKSARNSSACVCILDEGREPRRFRFVADCASDELKRCTRYIRGRCKRKGGPFVAGIERYYINAARAEHYDRVARSGRAKILISLLPGGSAQVVNFIEPR